MDGFGLCGPFQGVNCPVQERGALPICVILGFFNQSFTPKYFILSAARVHGTVFLISRSDSSLLE